MCIRDSPWHARAGGAHRRGPRAHRAPGQGAHAGRPPLPRREAVAGDRHAPGPGAGPPAAGRAGGGNERRGDRPDRRAPPLSGREALAGGGGARHALRGQHREEGDRAPRGPGAGGGADGRHPRRQAGHRRVPGALMLSVRGLDQYYGGSHTLRAVDLEVPAGTCTALLGRNGVGKTTLLRCLMGELPVRRGTVQLGGKDVTPLPSYERARLGMGYVPQGREIFSRLTVSENLSVGETAAGGGATVERAELEELFPI